MFFFLSSSWPYLLNLANSVSCCGMEPSCVMIKWSDLQPSPAWEHQGSDFNPSTCSAGLIKMNFLQATTLPTGQESCYIWNTLLRYCIKFIVGRHRRTLQLIFLWHFFSQCLLSCSSPPFYCDHHSGIQACFGKDCPMKTDGAFMGPCPFTTSSA